MNIEKLNRDAWRPVEDVRAVFEWIETWYSRWRRHPALGYLSPLECESQHHNGHPIPNPLTCPVPLATAICSVSCHVSARSPARDGRVAGPVAGPCDHAYLI
jgi:hypothetical protein